MKTIIAALCIPLSAFASASPSLTFVQGNVVIERKGASINATKGTEVQVGDKIRGEDGAHARLRMQHQQIVLRGQFKLTLGEALATSDLTPVELGEGQMRIITDQKKKLEKTVFIVKTPTSVAGVRGTDFYVAYGPLLGESEVICFSHEIEFASSDQKTKAVVVKAGQWGGLGGRFGSSIRPPINLPKNVLSDFQTRFSSKD